MISAVSEGEMSDMERRKLLAGAALSGVALGASGLAEGETAAVAAGRAPADPPFGPVTVAPGDPRYDSFRTAFNTRFTGSPGKVVVLDDPAQAAAALTGAGRKIAVRSGGHCLENFTTTPDIDLLIDLSELDGIYYDDRMGAFAVEAGATLGEVYATLFKGWGVTLPGGSCPDVGVGGHLAGGGWGFLSRRYGLACDHLYAVEVTVVDASGRPRTVVATREPDDPNRDLWWAHTGGGGGNFGLVTRYWLRSAGPATKNPGTLLPRAPRAMRRRIRMWSWDTMTQEAFTRLFHNHATWFAQNSAPGSPAAKLWGALFVGHRSAGTLGIVTGIDDDVPGADQMLEAHLSAVSAGVGISPVFETTEQLPWLDPGNWVVEPAGRQKVKNADLAQGFTDAQVAALWKHLGSTDYTNPSALLSLTGCGGEINRPAPGSTASAGRDVLLRAYFTTGNYTDTDERNLAWIRTLYRDVFAATGGVPVPNGQTAGAYINYPDTDLADPTWNTSGVPWSALYYRDNYARLQQVKRRYDPGNLFRHALSVRAGS
jgi:hypothetical protein